MIHTQWILKPDFYRQHTLHKHKPFGNDYRILLAGLSTYMYFYVILWMGDKTGNVDA